MSELRQNLATREWVLIAGERARRPSDFADTQRVASHALPAHDPGCPFCPGNEEQTAQEVMREPLTGPWQLRMVTNRYPALQRRGARMQCHEGVQRKLSGVGYHEVLVETPLHNLTPAQQTLEQVAGTLRAFQTRGREVMADPRIEQLIFFKNHGVHAGSSLRHSHGQLVAMPMVPHTLRRRIEDIRRVFDDEGECPHCRMLQIELAEKARLITQNSSFVAFVPYAAMSPFHIWIVPRRHGPTFLDQTQLELRHLAEVLRTVLAKLYAGLNDPDYNYNIHTAPIRDSSSAYLHWYVSVIPRVTRDAGFELGTGMYINPSFPEESADFLRAQPGAAGEAEPTQGPRMIGQSANPLEDTAQIVQTDQWQVDEAEQG